MKTLTIEQFNDFTFYFMIVSLIILAVLAYFSIRVEVMSSIRINVDWAIYRYNRVGDLDEHYAGPVSKDVMEPFWKTMLRFWDWSNKNIVDSGTYEKIKRYL